MSKKTQKPARKEKTLIDAAKLERLATERLVANRPEGTGGLRMEMKKGYVRYVAAEGISVYVPLTKTVGRVDLSGFSMEKGSSCVKDLGGLSYGAVHQQIDFSAGTEDEILAAFAAALDHMLGLPPREKKAKSQPGTVKPQGTGATDTRTEAAAAPKKSSKKDRAALIAKVAAEKNAAISPATAAEIA